MNIAELNAFITLNAERFRAGLRDAEGSMDTTAGRLGGTARKVGMGAGAALGAGLALGAAKNMEMGGVQAKLNAQLGTTGDIAAKAGEVAGQLYKDAYGESMAETGEAARQVLQQIGGMAGASADDVAKITGQVMSLSEAFDQDLGSTTRAVDQMMRTGLASSAQEAMDILTRGFQSGVNEADDLLDTMAEYGTMFREVGLSGEMATGLMSQGLKAGARDADTVADAIKEFSIRAKDGSKATAEGFSAIGLSATDMGAKLAKGGDEATAVLDMTLDRLRAMEDPVARDAAAVALFGTKAEDLGDALWAMDPSEAVAALGQVSGAAEGLDTSLRDRAGVTLESVKRNIEGFAMSLAGLPGPMGVAGAAITTYGGQALAVLGPIGMMISANRAAAAATAASGATQQASMIRTAAVTVANWVRMAAVSMANAVRMAASWVIAMGPVGWIIAAVIGLVALIIANWDTIKQVTIDVWNAIVGWVVDVVGNIVSAVTDGVSGAYNAVVEWLGQAVAWVAALPGRILSALGNLGSLLLNAGRDLIMGLWNGIAGMGSWLFDKIIGFVKSFVPGPVLQFLGIASPSKLMEGYGEEVPRGFAKGVDNEAGMVGRSTEAMAMAAARGTQLGGGTGLRTRSGPRSATTEAALYRAVHDALHGARMEVDGSGVARLVNRSNLIGSRRGAALAI